MNENIPGHVQFIISIQTYEEHRLLQVRISLILYVTSQQALTAKTQRF